MSGADLAGILACICTGGAATLAVFVWRSRRFAPRNITRVVLSRPLPAPVNYDSPVWRDRRREVMQGLAYGGKTVTMAREIANRAETLLVDLSHNADAQDALGNRYDPLLFAAVRKAISDAIEVCDRDT